MTLEEILEKALNDGRDDLLMLSDIERHGVLPSGHRSALVNQIIKQEYYLKSIKDQLQIMQTLKDCNHG